MFGITEGCPRSAGAHDRSRARSKRPFTRALFPDAALSSAFVPIFSGLLAKDEKIRAWRVASSVLWLFLLGLTGLTALYMLLTPLIMSAFPYDQALLVGLSRVLFPTVALLGVTGIIVGVLNSYDHFTVPALT